MENEETSPTDIDFQKVCRTCLSEGKMRSLYEDCNSETCLLEMLMSCTLVQFSENDGLPAQMCVECINEIERAYKFAQKCQDSDKTLRQVFKVPKTQRWNKKTCSKSRRSKKNVAVLAEQNEFSSKPNSTFLPPSSVIQDEERDSDYLDDCKEEVLEDSSGSLLEPVVKTKPKLDVKPESCEVEEPCLDASIENDNNTQLKKARKSKPGGKLKSSPPYECKKCYEKFPLYYLLKEHFKKAQHSKRDYAKRVCNICSKSVSYSHLKHHIRTHTLEKPYCCEFCGKRFIISSNLSRHKRTHSGEKPYPCDICGKCFSQSTRMKEHRRLHTGERPFVCNFCGKSFVQMPNFKSHMRRHEKEDVEMDVVVRKSKALSDKTIKCDQCNQIFSSNGALKTHQVTHGEKKFTCSDCGRGFISMERLKNHSKSHADVKPFSCVICNKSFTMKTTLKNHMYIHSGEKPFPCNLCEKAFTQLGQLKYHLRTHSGERPYSCSYCGKSFALNGNLTVHLRTHTGETPYVCPVCNKGFYDSSSMKKHQRGHVDVLK